MITIKPLAPTTGIAVFLALTIFLATTSAALAHDPNREQASIPAAAIAPLSEGDAIPFALGGPWSLIDHKGRARNREDFRGQFRIIYFGYTSCPYTCTTAATNIAVVLDNLADGGQDMGALFITIDPAFDTPERLAEYVTAIHPRMLGLTGEADEINRLQKSFQVHAREVVDKGDFERLFDHQPLAFLMGPEGDILTFFPPILPPFEITRIIRGYL